MSSDHPPVNVTDPGLQQYLQEMYRPPLATYRLQMTPTFGFLDAREITAYLAALGITDVYSSPFFRAKPGSTHGYDVCDFGELNPELGGDKDFAVYSQALREHGLGLVLDFVPNHMAVESVMNPWWRDMLEHGRASPYAKFFDVDWNPIKTELRSKVLLPFLGDHYGLVLERGELSLAMQNGQLVVQYYDLTRPLDPRSYPMVLRIGLDELNKEMGDSLVVEEFLSIITALGHIPPTWDTSTEGVANRLRESRIAKERLAVLVETSPRVRKHIEDAIKTINGQVGQPDSFNQLHEVLEAQVYRLAYWKTAFHEINYRRFFDINQLAGLRVEEPAVFQAMHSLALQLIRSGILTGLRLDHIDGLFDPTGYLKLLQRAILKERVETYLESSQNQDTNTAELVDALLEQDPVGRRGHRALNPLYVVVEKILSGNESLPPWPSAGTSGYDYMNDVSRLFINPRNARIMRQTYERFTGYRYPFADVVYDCKKLITWTSLASELNVLADALDRLSEGDRRTRDFTLESLREALREVAVCFPVYRTYVGPNGNTETDRQILDLAILRARRRNPAMESSVFDFVRKTLLPDRETMPESVYQSRLRFAGKFQQYTGPLQAKGVEDTAFYRYNVLVSLNEVGGDPQRFGGTIAQFHQANQQRLANMPNTMIATATHDTKRGEDARMRIHALSELPATWAKRVQHWEEINETCRTMVDGILAPDRNDEYLFYQCLLAAWPADYHEPRTPPELLARLRDYMLKATKEAKLHTSWIAPNEEYDQSVINFVEGVLAGPRSREFLARFLPFQKRVAHVGMLNSLAQVALKLTSPGIPDIYQGTELWDYSLVDPDNRRPVNYKQRREMLEALEPWLDPTSTRSVAERQAAISRWLVNWPDGTIKLFLTAAGLRLRKRHPEVYLQGDYIPLATEGERANHVVAFARRWNNQWILTVAPRLIVLLSGSRATYPLGERTWRDTTLLLPEELRQARFQHVLTGETWKATDAPDQPPSLRLLDIMTTSPVAFLEVSEVPGAQT